MKKTITLLAIILATVVTSTNAQLQKGNVLVGGDLANFRLGLNSGGQFSMNLTPKAAWFIQNNLAVGAFADISVFTAKGQKTAVGYAVGPMARYYINDPKVNILNHGRWFFEGNVGIGGTNAGGSSTNGLNLGFGPGFAYFITENVGLETLLKYDGFLGFGNAATASNLSLGVGFQIYLPGRTARAAIKSVQ
jgi:hypothetical protein